MLYRNPRLPLPLSQPGLVRRALRMLGALSWHRRRRRADLDLLALSDHLRRDLGLDGVSPQDLSRR